MREFLFLDRGSNALFDATGRRLEAATRRWSPPTGPIVGEQIDAVQAATWLQRTSGHPIRVPVGVIGPRDPSASQYALAEQAAYGIASMGLLVICGGRSGVMEAACKGAARAGGVSIGLLPDPDPGAANDFATVVVATGIGEARNALIARASLCLVAIGDSYGTLSEVALGRQFGKQVIGLEGAARVDGVVHCASVPEALELIAACVLGTTGGGSDRS